MAGVKGTMRWTRGLVALTALAVTAACAGRRADEPAAGPPAPDWPKITEITRSAEVVYVARAAENGVELVINSDKGAPLYTLKCHTLDHHDPSGESLTYTGMMQCYLFPWRRTIGEPNLLDPANRSIGDESRGRFARGHVMPNCVRTPEWGGERHFFLRGMAITLAVTNRRYQTFKDTPDRPVLEAFTFQVKVQNQPKALSAQAQPVPTPRPDWFDNGVCPTGPEPPRPASRIIR